MAFCFVVNFNSVILHPAVPIDINTYVYFKILLCFLITFGLLGCEKSVETVSCLDDSLYGQMMVIQGGEFQFGESRYYPDEGPIQTTFVNDFKISITEVTNKEFAEFVEATGYVTDAERGLSEDEYPQIPKNLEYQVPWYLLHLSQISQRPRLLGGDLLLAPIEKSIWA